MQPPAAVDCSIASRRPCLGVRRRHNPSVLLAAIEAEAGNPYSEGYLETGLQANVVVQTQQVILRLHFVPLPVDREHRHARLKPGLMRYYRVSNARSGPIIAQGSVDRLPAVRRRCRTTSSAEVLSSHAVSWQCARARWLPPGCADGIAFSAPECFFLTFP